jgi:type II secretory pathway predicted ATPase ExeA
MIQNLQSHWGFTIMPFGPAIPVPGLFGSAAHNEAVARLRWLISARGLGVLTGEVGSGKTVAVRAATGGLDASRNTLIYLPNPQIGTRGIHGAIATALGQSPRFHHATLIPQVEAALAAETGERNRHVILAIDESHLMSGDQLDAVRMLTLCRGRDYAGERGERRGSYFRGGPAFGIIPGFRGRRGACRAAGSGRAWSSGARCGRGPVP